MLLSTVTTMGLRSLLKQAHPQAIYDAFTQHFPASNLGPDQDARSVSRGIQPAMGRREPPAVAGLVLQLNMGSNSSNREALKTMKITSDNPINNAY